MRLLRRHPPLADDPSVILHFAQAAALLPESEARREVLGVQVSDNRKVHLVALDLVALDLVALEALQDDEGLARRVSWRPEAPYNSTT